MSCEMEREGKGEGEAGTGLGSRRPGKGGGGTALRAVIEVKAGRPRRRGSRSGRGGAG